ncbi:MAG: 4-hydroxy-tetrahydrodipicolinate synthase [Bacteroidaceae bacterium]|nr:4-hydroxy-tetrahydrodipicolinate synthase [Bacteroidaceae bacterium]
MNTTPFPFHGLGIALVTPFHADGSVDYDALKHLVDYQICGGIDFLVVLGTTSEAPCLTVQEKRDIRQCVVQQVAGRVPVVIGCGGNCTAEVVSEMRADNFEGMSGLLSVVPFYNKPNQEGLYQHFRAVAEAAPLPLLLYNVPSRTGANLASETTLRLASDCPNIVGIKEASGNMEQIQTILNQRPQHFHVLSGDDSLTLDMMKMGAEGVISVIGNALPRQFRRMITLFEEGQQEEAQHINQQLHDLYRLLFIDGNPAGIKALLHLMGIADNVLRLPLTPMHLNFIEKMQVQIRRMQLV